MPEPRRRLSVSQLNSYSRCPMLFFLEKIQKVPSPPSAALIKGNVVHAVLEHWELTDREVPVEVNYDMFWDDELEVQLERNPDIDTWGKSPKPLNVANDLRYAKRDGLAEVLRYTARARQESELWEVYKLPDGSLALEIPFSIDFGDVECRGRIDVVQRWKHDGSVTVGDYKTGSPSSESNRQLGTYRVGLRETYGVDVDYGNFWYTKLDRSSGWIDLRRYTKDYLQEQYSALDRAITNNIFIPAPSADKCRSCSVRQYCPEMKDN